VKSIKAKGRGKGQAAPPQPAVDREYHGVGAVLNRLAKLYLLDFEQISSRLMSISISLQTAGPPIHILNAYAPQSGVASHIKEAFYDQVESCLTTLPRAHPKYVFGDFNARIHAKLDHEHMFGPHIFGRGRKYLHFTSDEVAENRYMFLIFCASCDLKVMNTFFQKVPENQFTFREPATNHEPPWTPERFAQLDYVLAPESLKDGKNQ